VVFCFIGGVSFHPGANRERLVEVGLQPKGYAAYLIYTPFDRSSPGADQQDVDLQLDQFVEELRQTGGIAVSVARYDRDVPAFDISQLSQPRAQCVFIGSGSGWIDEVKLANRG
jgi:hypothetical protein